MSKWTFDQKFRNVHVLRVELDRISDEQWILLQSDVHWDNPHCDREMLKKHLNLALQRNAPVMDAGDFFCAMQGKYDPRASKKDIRPEHQDTNYLDTLVSTAADYLAPYAKILTLRGRGNHETSIGKRHETDLTERLAERLKMQGSPAMSGGYGGFVRINVKVQKNNTSKGFVYHYYHGSGGGGPVTRGVIQTNRMSAYLADCDIVHTGHTHDAWQMPIARVRLNAKDHIEHSRITFIRTAGYKEEYGDGFGGWHIERGGPPKPVGAAWLRLFCSKKDQFDYEIHEAR
jgi:hypothetical protein